MCSWEYLILVFNTHIEKTHAYTLTHTHMAFLRFSSTIGEISALFCPRFALEQLSHEPDMRRERLLYSAVVTLLPNNSSFFIGR